MNDYDRGTLAGLGIGFSIGLIACLMLFVYTGVISGV